MEGKQLIPDDGTGWGKRGKAWFTPRAENRERRLEARVTSLEAQVITLAKRIDALDPVHGFDLEAVDRLIQVTRDLPGNPSGVRLSDRRRAEIAHALQPFGVTGFQPPHRAPQEDAA